jgi:uncharacterized protein (TIGR02145 family)
MNKTFKVIFSILVCGIIFSFWSNNSLSQVTDIDGNAYKTVTIGTQVWMTENLNVEHYRNGDVILQVKEADKWQNLKTGAWCYYENNPEFGKTYGKLYNWYAVNDPRGLTPVGWHIPSDTEWALLIDYLGGENVAGSKLKATTLWDSTLFGYPDQAATNESGVSAFPGGNRTTMNGSFLSLGNAGFYWSASECYEALAWSRILICDYLKAFRDYFNKGNGLSVRCIKD